MKRKRRGIGGRGKEESLVIERAEERAGRDGTRGQDTGVNIVKILLFTGYNNSTSSVCSIHNR